MNGRLYIDGQWLEADSGARIEVRDPGSGELVGSVPDAGAFEAERVAAAAQAAFAAWARLPAVQRARHLQGWAVAIRERAEEIARLVTRESGKPLAEARGEVLSSAEAVEWYAEECRRVYGETIPAHVPDKRILVLRQPMGVAAVITPWNFPVGILARKAATALAAGCTVVVKPAEQTPLSAVALFQALDAAGLPPGVANLVTGAPAPIVEAWMRDPTVRKVTFTGSTTVGKLLIRASADTVKKLHLELGGHAPFIVFADADVEQAARDFTLAKFLNSGQRCSAPNRLYVQRPVARHLADLLRSNMARLVMGHGLGNGVQVGPLVGPEAVGKVEAQVQDALARGADLLCGGRVRRDGHFAAGHFFEPTLLAGVTPEMRVYQEETFGPVAPMITFDTEAEVIRAANASPYGLTSYVYTRDLSRAIRASEGLEYGIVGINDPLPTVNHAPFGGWKQSGIGREGGRHGIEEFLEIKYVSVGLIPEGR